MPSLFRFRSQLLGLRNPGAGAARQPHLFADLVRGVVVELGKLPNSDKQASTDDQKASPDEPSSLADLGLTVTKSDDGKGLVVTDVDPDSDAADRGIQAGDIITAVNSQDVSTTGDVTRAMDDAAKSGRKSVLVQISRDDNNRFVALPVGHA